MSLIEQTPPINHQRGWSEERAQILEDRWRAGISATLIAQELGGITRSGVIGKAHRMGLPEHNWHTVHRYGRGVKRPPRTYAKERKPIAEPEDLSKAVMLMQLNSHTCRWPLGDPRDLEAMKFCGAEPQSEKPYCTRHCRMAYEPIRKHA